MENYKTLWKELKVYIEDNKDCLIDGRDLLTIMNALEEGDYSAVVETPLQYTKYLAWCARERVVPDPRRC